MSNLIYVAAISHDSTQDSEESNFEVSDKTFSRKKSYFYLNGKILVFINLTLDQYFVMESKLTASLNYEMILRWDLEMDEIRKG